MRCVHVHHDVFSVLFLLLYTTHRLHCLVPICATLYPHVKVVTLIISNAVIHDTIMYILHNLHKGIKKFIPLQAQTKQ